MDKAEILDILKRSRELLDRAYIKWTADDGNGGHCAQGCVDRHSGGRLGTFCDTIEFLEGHARALRPDLNGATGVREDAREIGRLGLDRFSAAPLIYINNHVGKQAALAVFDSAILELEIALAAEKDLAPAEVEMRALVEA